MNNSTGTDNRKEEILARSRQSGNDEGVEYAQIKAGRLAWVTVIPVALILFITAQFSDIPNIFNIVITVFCATLFSAHIAIPIYAYQFSKQKKYLYEAICYLFLLIFTTYGAVSLMLGW